MFTIIFWIIIGIIGVLSGVYIFLLTNSISSKAHNKPESKKVVSSIIIVSLIGFLVFGWNTYILFSTLNNFNTTLSPSIDNSGTKSSTPSSNNSSNTNTDGYTNF